MGIIKAVNLIFDYIRHDEEEDKDEVSHALKGVSLDIKEGDFVAILGHNGSGKSTFAKLMNGILLPSLGCTKDGGNGIPEPGQPDHRKRGGRGCRIRTGEHGSSDGGNLGAGRQEP